MDPIFQVLLSSLGSVSLREGLHLCHGAAVGFGGSLPELVCCRVEGCTLGGLELRKVLCSCTAGAALKKDGGLCLGVILEYKIYGFREYLALH